MAAAVCYAWMDVRVLAVLAAAAALVTGATVPYVRSRTDRSAPDGGHCLGWPAGPLEFRENAAGAPGTGDAGFLAMEKSLATWATAMKACGNLSLTMGPRTTTRSVGFDDRTGASNENVLMFRTRLCSGLVPPDDACIASRHLRQRVRLLGFRPRRRWPSRPPPTTRGPEGYTTRIWR